MPSREERRQNVNGGTRRPKNSVPNEMVNQNPDTAIYPQELLHVDMDARVDIRDGQMKGINEKALVFTVFRYGFPDTSFC